ncbi:hypothetical protein HDV04_002290, partial [Boothiomyces sp. JEL0838]
MKFHFLYTTALAYSCNQIKADSLEYNIASLFPSEDVYELKYNFCNSITDPGVDKTDFCADGTWACRLIKNNKNKNVRITSAKPIGSSEPIVTTNGDILGLRLKAENGSVTLNIKCKASVTDSTPALTSYKDDDIVLNWEHAAGCNTALSTPNSSSTNIFAALFFYSLGGLFAYFAIGSIANYVLKGETRFPDILPHSDFWVALGATVW